MLISLVTYFWNATSYLVYKDHRLNAGINPRGSKSRVSTSRACYSGQPFHTGENRPRCVLLEIYCRKKIVGKGVKINISKVARNCLNRSSI